MKKGIRRLVYALLMTLFVTALLTGGNGLGSLVFGTKCDIHGITFSMAFFCMWKIFYNEFKNWYED